MWIYLITPLLATHISVLTELGFYLEKKKKMYCKFNKISFYFSEIEETRFFQLP